MMTQTLSIVMERVRGYLIMYTEFGELVRGRQLLGREASQDMRRLSESCLDNHCSRILHEYILISALLHLTFHQIFRKIYETSSINTHPVSGAIALEVVSKCMNSLEWRDVCGQRSPKMVR